MNSELLTLAMLSAFAYASYSLITPLVSKGSKFAAQAENDYYMKAKDLRNQGLSFSESRDLAYERSVAQLRATSPSPKQGTNNAKY